MGITFTGDDEEPNCMSCDYCSDGTWTDANGKKHNRCSEACGPQSGWYSYRRTEIVSQKNEKGKNAHYWINKDVRAKTAESHHHEMESKFSKEINKAVAQSKVYDDTNIMDRNIHTSEPEVLVVANDTVSAAFKYKLGRTAILNFASYKEPGGMFLQGSKAQEECLCHESCLYEVLSRIPTYYEWNKNHLNRGLYLNRAIASPSVIFHHSKNPFFSEINKFDVITCAAPNASVFTKYNKDNGEVKAVLESRIQFIKRIVESGSNGKIETLILGAYGCGVFGLEPKMVAETFKKYFTISSVHRIVYAVIDEQSENYKSFYEVLSK